MTIDPTAADRPIPDEADLRLLGELVANVSIPLANAAWNAQMSQAEAAGRLVSMAERGLPLRLVADGDRNALWQLVQAGPVAAVPAVTEAVLPEATAVPEETAAAVPAAPEVPVAAIPEVPATPEIPPVPLPETAPEIPAAPLPPEISEHLTPDPVAVEPQVPEPAAVPPIAEPEPAPAAPTWATHAVAGPAGEQLQVTILEVIDPAPRSTIVAGAPIVDGYRAVLVRSRVANTGPIPYPAPGDANLVVETDQRVLIGRAGLPPAHLPPFGGAIAPGETAEGWSLFAVTEDTALVGLKWCIRPDIPQTIVEWPISAF